mmetsp:Transcript_23671/g.32603  ORF Transcript_23671/g.32603 Transcript_23671/m.32603 type:complete len:111 (+) Transcript_23671:582-914(+)
MKGLYRGLSAPLIGGSFECGVNYGVFYGVNKYMQGGKEGLDMDLKGLVVSGMAAGTVLSFILSPTELIKCRLRLARLLDIHHTKDQSMSFKDWCKLRDSAQDWEGAWQQP